jgi:hypothetical protein
MVAAVAPAHGVALGAQPRGPVPVPPPCPHGVARVVWRCAAGRPSLAASRFTTTRRREVTLSARADDAENSVERVVAAERQRGEEEVRGLTSSAPPPRDAALQASTALAERDEAQELYRTLATKLSATLHALHMQERKREVINATRTVCPRLLRSLTAACRPSWAGCAPCGISATSRCGARGVLRARRR